MQRQNSSGDDSNAIPAAAGECSRMRSVDVGISTSGEASRMGELLTFCEREGDMHILTITRGSTMADLYEKVKNRWDGSCEVNTTLHYVEPEGGFIVELRSDTDVEHMCHVHELVKKGTCRMMARPISPPKKRTRYGEQ